MDMDDDVFKGQTIYEDCVGHTKNSFAINSDGNLWKSGEEETYICRSDYNLQNNDVVGCGLASLTDNRYTFNRYIFFTKNGHIMGMRCGDF
jgi:hypothetical protein